MPFGERWYNTTFDTTETLSPAAPTLPCLLLDSPSNQKWGPVDKIYSLDKEEIEECYHLFMNTIFSDFKDLLEEYERY